MNEMVSTVLAGILANPNVNPLDTRVQGAAVKAAKDICMAVWSGPIFTPPPQPGDGPDKAAMEEPVLAVKEPTGNRDQQDQAERPSVDSEVATDTQPA